MITIHVLTAGELFKQVLNAVATFSGSDLMSIMRISALISLILASFHYIKSQDISVFIRWLLTYLFVVGLVLTPRVPVAIQDSSNPGKAMQVDNVPVVLALTASVFTTLGHKLAASFDSLLALPDDLAYNQSGLLFGATLYQALHDVKISTPKLNRQMNDYFRNCIVGDVLLNEKYSFADMRDTSNLWQLVSSKPSPLRRVSTFGRETISCRVATAILKKSLSYEIKHHTMPFYGTRLFGREHRDYSVLFERYLAGSVNYFQDLSMSATALFQQAMMINAIRDGVADYQARTNATAGLINYTYTKSMQTTRLSWMASGKKAASIMPLMHTIITLIMLGLFPIVAALLVLPMGGAIAKHYALSLLWLQLWSPLFAILNLGMTYYIRARTGHDAGLTLASFDSTVQLHNDISGLCGYLMIFVPFLAKSVLSGMMESFTALATSISHNLQGATMGASSEAVMGNFAIGQTSYHNVSANNVHANKHDTNWTDFHGTATEQMATGVTKSITESGNIVYNVSPGMSQIAQSLNMGEQLGSQTTHQAELAEAASRSDAASFQRSINHGVSSLEQLSQSVGHDSRLGEGVSQGTQTNVDNALAKMNAVASDVARRNGITHHEALTNLSQASLGAQATIGGDRGPLGALGKWAIGATASGTASGSTQRSHTNSHGYDTGTSHDLSEREVSDFRESLSVVSNAATSQHYDDSHSNNQSLMNQVADDFRQAENAATSYEAHYNQSQRLSEAASFTHSHLASVNANLTQGFVDYVVDRVGEYKADGLFGNPQAISSQETLKHMSEQYIGQVASNIQDSYQDFKSGVNPEGFFQANSQVVGNQASMMPQSSQTNRESMRATADSLGVNYSQQNAQDFQQQVKSGIHQAKEKVTDGANDIHQQAKQVDAEANKNFEATKARAKTGVLASLGSDGLSAFSKKHKQDDTGVNS